MKITYTGRHVELAPAQLRKIEVQLTKVGKLLDGKDEREAHVVLSLERHLHKAEVTVNYHSHQLVGIGSSEDMFTAIHAAIAKLEKQAIKVRAKWRDTKRTPRKETMAAAAPAGPDLETGSGKKVYRTNDNQRRRSLSIEEAIVEMGKTRDYLVYRNVETEVISVLVRRRDGHFDLIES